MAHSKEATYLYDEIKYTVSSLIVWWRSTKILLIIFVSLLYSDLHFFGLKFLPLSPTWIWGNQITKMWYQVSGGTPETYFDSYNWTPFVLLILKIILWDTLIWRILYILIYKIERRWVRDVTDNLTCSPLI